LAAVDIGALVRDGGVVLAAYFIGGIPWGILVARLLGGRDPRTIGSGRTGGANVLRALGLGAAALVALLDVAKGAVVVIIARAAGADLPVQVLVALAAILGHSRSPYIGFGGGRGVATGLGSLIVLQPLIAAAVLPIFGVVIAVSRYSSLASLASTTAAGIGVALAVAIGGLPGAYLLYAIVGTGMIWYFHRDNIDRLMRGRENKIGPPG
jgi:glycerol-3-phosphate acyltransferase PlsY